MRLQLSPCGGHLSGSVIAVFLATALAIAGCGQAGPAGTIWVNGTVVHDGKPLPEGAVHFLGKERNAGASGSARLQGGKFGLYLAPGNYSIAVVSEDGVAETDMKTGRMVLAKSRIPLRYTTVTDSGLSAQVDTGHRTVSLVLEPQ